MKDLEKIVQRKTNNLRAVEEGRSILASEVEAILIILLVLRQKVIASGGGGGEGKAVAAA